MRHCRYMDYSIQSKANHTIRRMNGQYGQTDRHTDGRISIFVTSNIWKVVFSMWVCIFANEPAVLLHYTTYPTIYHYTKRLFIRAPTLCPTHSSSFIFPRGRLQTAFPVCNFVIVPFVIVPSPSPSHSLLLLSSWKTICNELNRRRCRRRPRQRQRLFWNVQKPHTVYNKK